MTPLSLEAKIWFYLVSVMLILSGLDPVADRLTWWLETTPALIGLIVLSLTRAQFPLTNISYRLIAVFSLILIFGGHYTYAENPLFNWIQEQWALERNYYDRLGHFFQGVVPAMVGREILLRTSPLERGKWLFFILCTISLAISAFYELIEWWVALMSGEAADAFLGTQGDNWDTQWDMFLALTGSILAQLFLSKGQDRQLKLILSKD
jgi:putative membrane protein